MQIPVTKFDPSLVTPHLQDPTLTTFDRWDQSDYSIPPLLEQFPDYDWAAGFDFSNSNYPTVPIGPMNPVMQQGNMANMGYTFG